MAASFLVSKKVSEAGAGGVGHRDGRAGPALTRRPCLQRQPPVPFPPRSLHPAPCPSRPRWDHGQRGLASAKLLDSAPACFLMLLPTWLPLPSVLGPERCLPLNWPTSPPPVASSSLLPLLGVFFLLLSSSGLCSKSTFPKRPLLTPHLSQAPRVPWHAVPLVPVAPVMVCSHTAPVFTQSLPLHPGWLAS